ncbi:MAG: shikimate kinase [Bacteroidales bacterium]
MRIILVGFMSCGKSTIGKQLARRMNMESFDIDEAFESKYKMTINNFFELFGENKFRELEHGILMESLKQDNVIISTGGGTPCFYNNMQIINNNGISVYLKLHPKSIIDRLLNTKRQRPLLKNFTPEELSSFVYTQLSKRESYYSQSRFIFPIENKKPNEVYSLLKQSFDEIGLVFPTVQI